MVFAAEYLYVARHKIAAVAVVDIYKLLRIPVCQREPGTLNLYHNAVPFLKYMCHIG